MQAIIVLLLILAVLLVIFTLQNQVGITIHLFLWEIKDAPLVLVIVACIVIGYILASIYFYPRLWKIKKEYNKLSRFNKELKEYREMHETKKTTDVEDPEGIELDDDDEEDSFFKD